MGMWKDLRKFGHLVSNKMFFVVVDGQRIKFWGIDGVGIPLYVMLFCLFLSLLSQRKLGWGMFGVLNKVGDVGTLPSLGCLMTGNWRMCQDSCFI